MKDVAELQIAGLNVSRETLGKIEELEALVRRWNPAINLVSKTSLDDLRERHVIDSAQLFSACPPTARQWADLGSGGGFPGLIVAIIARELQPDLEVTLVESDARKATFLRQAGRSLGVRFAVFNERIESLAPLSADVLSARALAALPQLLAYAERHLRQDGLALLPKGARYADELAEARKQWHFEVETRPSQSESGAAILLIRKIERARQN